MKFYCLGPYLIVIRQREIAGKLSGHEIYRIAKTEIIPFSRTSLHLNDAQVKSISAYLFVANFAF